MASSSPLKPATGTSYIFKLTHGDKVQRFAYTGAINAAVYSAIVSRCNQRFGVPSHAVVLTYTSPSPPTIFSTSSPSSSSPLRISSAYQFIHIVQGLSAAKLDAKDRDKTKPIKLHFLVVDSTKPSPPRATTVSIKNTSTSTASGLPQQPSFTGSISSITSSTTVTPTSKDFMQSFKPVQSSIKPEDRRSLTGFGTATSSAVGPRPSAPAGVNGKAVNVKLPPTGPTTLKRPASMFDFVAAPVKIEKPKEVKKEELEPKVLQTGLPGMTMTVGLPASPAMAVAPSQQQSSKAVPVTTSSTKSTTTSVPAFGQPLTHATFVTAPPPSTSNTSSSSSNNSNSIPWFSPHPWWPSSPPGPHHPLPSSTSKADWPAVSSFGRPVVPFNPIPFTFRGDTVVQDSDPVVKAKLGQKDFHQVVEAAVQRRDQAAALKRASTLPAGRTTLPESPAVGLNGVGTVKAEDGRMDKEEAYGWAREQYARHEQQKKEKEVLEGSGEADSSSSPTGPVASGSGSRVVEENSVKPSEVVEKMEKGKGKMITVEGLKAKLTKFVEEFGKEMEDTMGAGGVGVSSADERSDEDTRRDLKRTQLANEQSMQRFAAMQTIAKGLRRQVTNSRKLIGELELESAKKDEVADEAHRKLHLEVKELHMKQALARRRIAALETQLAQKTLSLTQAESALVYLRAQSDPSRTAHNATCDLCDQQIVGIRHKCAQCPDWDVCSLCLPSTVDLHPNHTLIPISTPIPITLRPADVVLHPGSICTGCNKQIRGPKYVCAGTHTSPCGAEMCGNCLESPLEGKRHAHRGRWETDVWVRVGYPARWGAGMVQRRRGMEMAKECARERQEAEVEGRRVVSEDGMGTPTQDQAQMPGEFISEPVFESNAVEVDVEMHDDSDSDYYRQLFEALDASRRQYEREETERKAAEALVATAVAASAAEVVAAKSDADADTEVPTMTATPAQSSAASGTVTPVRTAAEKGKGREVEPEKEKSLVELWNELAETTRKPKSSAVAEPKVEEKVVEPKVEVKEKKSENFIDLLNDFAAKALAPEPVKVEKKEEGKKEDDQPNIAALWNDFASALDGQTKSRGGLFRDLARVLTATKDVVEEKKEEKSVKEADVSSPIQRVETRPLVDHHDMPALEPISDVEGEGDNTVSTSAPASRPTTMAAAAEKEDMLELVHSSSEEEEDEVVTAATPKPMTQSASFARRAVKAFMFEDMPELERDSLGPSRVSSPAPFAVKPASAVLPSGSASAAVEPKLDARFVDDVTLEDGTSVPSGAVFHKIWRVRNNGTVAWPAGTTLKYVRGGLKGGEATVDEVEAGKEVEVEVKDVHAPEEEGDCHGLWRLTTKDGEAFGDKLWISIHVDAPGSNASSLASSSSMIIPAMRSDGKTGPSLPSVIPSSGKTNESNPSSAIASPVARRPNALPSLSRGSSSAQQTTDGSESGTDDLTDLGSGSYLDEAWSDDEGEWSMGRKAEEKEVEQAARGNAMGKNDNKGKGKVKSEDEFVEVSDGETW